MRYRIIDIEKYPRKAHFEYFRSLTYPYVGVTADVDVTELLKKCRDEGISFYLSFLHAAALAADSIPEFRQRIKNDGIVEYAHCGTSHIELLDDNTYCYCTLRHEMPFEDYIVYAEDARKKARESGKGIEEDEDSESLYFITTLPWIHYTSLIQPVAGGDESNPRISWGGYREDRSGRTFLPVSVLVHHALADGLQIAEFYRNIDTELTRITGRIAETKNGENR